MLDRLLNSPALAIGFIVLVIYLAFVYFTNRTRAKVAQMQGPRRFRPDWSHGKDPRRRRRRPARGGGFAPQWSSGRDKRGSGAGDEPKADDPEPPGGDAERSG